MYTKAKHAYTQKLTTPLKGCQDGSEGKDLTVQARGPEFNLHPSTCNSSVWCVQGMGVGVYADRDIGSEKASFRFSEEILSQKLR